MFICAMHYSIQFYFHFKAIPLPILLALLHSFYTFTQYGEIFFFVCAFFPPIFPIAFHLQIHFYLGILILFCICSQLVVLFTATITHEINSRKRAKTSNMKASRRRNKILFNYASFTHKIPFLILRLSRYDSKA
jgi:hypothetical protein